MKRLFGPGLPAEGMKMRRHHFPKANAEFSTVIVNGRRVESAVTRDSRDYKLHYTYIRLDGESLWVPINLHLNINNKYEVK